MSPKNQGRPPSPDDAWANLDESDDWHERSGVREGGGQDRIVQTATNMRIRPEEAQKATKGPHLVVVAGAEVGRIYALSGSEVTVGRGEMNDIVLADGSVSRQHARLERRQGHWYVHDLDSGNGTFVQARRVRSAELPLGEQVGFGQVRLQLRESRVAPEAGGNRALGPRPDRADMSVAKGPAAKASSPAVASATAGQAPRPALRPGPAGGGARPAQGSELSLAQLRPALAAAGRSVWGKAALAAVVLCLGAGWLALYLEGRSSAEEVFRLCQHAAKSFDAREFDEAEQALAQARALVPQHPRVASWTAALRQARADEERLAAAREALGAQDLATARAHVQVLAGSSLYAQIEQLDTELDRAEKALLVEAHTALQAGLQQEAGALLARLGAAAPGEQGSREDPRRRSDVAALARWRHAQQNDAPLLAKVERWGARPRRKLSLWEQAEGQSPALRRALAAFRNARAEAASRLGLRALGRPQVRKDQQVAGAMQRFATLWDTGLEEHRGKRAFAAIRVFTDAKLLALALGGEGSVPVRELNARLADMYYVVGMQAFAAGKLAEAAEALRVALGLSPEHALSARRMEEIEDRAVHMVDQAEFIGKKHPARAKELLRQVAAAMPPPSEVGGRARRLLQGATP